MSVMARRWGRFALGCGMAKIVMRVMARRLGRFALGCSMAKIVMSDGEEVGKVCFGL